MPNVPTPPGIEIKALKQRRREVQFNLMEPGPGIPWEDRGTLGTLPSWWRTTMLGLRHPVMLMRAIRRPETERDAMWFALWCAAAWGLSFLIHSAMLLAYYSGRPGVTVDAALYWIESVAGAVLAVAMVVLATRMMASIYRKLAVEDLKNRAAPALILNMCAYALAPSVVAIVPLLGPPIAVAWIVLLVIAGGIRRLHVRPVSGVIYGLIATAAAGGMIWGVYFVLGLAWGQIAGGSVDVR